MGAVWWGTPGTRPPTFSDSEDTCVVASSSSQHDLAKDRQMLHDSQLTIGKKWKPRPDYDELWKPVLGHDVFKPIPLRSEPIHEFKPFPIKSESTDVDVANIIMKQIGKTCLQKCNEFRSKQSQPELELPGIHGRVFTRADGGDSEGSLESVLLSKRA